MDYDQVPTANVVFLSSIESKEKVNEGTRSERIEKKLLKIVVI